MTAKLSSKGFSLLELLMVLSIFGAILLMMIPSWSHLTSRNRALAKLEELKAAIHFTRFNAILLGETVKFCGSSNHKKCDGNWNNGQVVITESGAVLRVLSKIFLNDDLEWKGGALARDYVLFSSTGFTLSRQPGSFHYHPKNYPQNAMQLTLNPLGRCEIKKAGNKK
jgi:prepilin-type N-terminal cleavage/methylation domain-containing protein